MAFQAEKACGLSKKYLGAIVLALIAVRPVSGQGTKYSKEGCFIGLSGSSLSFQGDLDKDLVLWHFEKAFFVPRMERATGFGLGFGFKKDSALWNIVVLRSSHKTDLQGKASQSTFYSIDVSGRAFLLKNAPFQPYLLFGLSIPFIHVKDGSKLHDSISHATYYGIGLNFGSGIVIHLRPRLFISSGVIYRYLAFLYVSGEGTGRDINDLRVGYGGPEWGKLLWTRSLGLSFGIGFTF